MARRRLFSPLQGETARAPGDAGLFARPYPKAAGSLGSLYSCVPAMLTFPRQINAGENQDLYFAAQLALDALADSGMRPSRNSPVRGAVAIGYAPPFNSATVNWLEHTYFIDQTMEIIEKFFPSAPVESLAAIRRKMKDAIPEPDAASFVSGTGGRIAAWIARECGFDGEANLVDSASLSGLSALRQAVDALRAGRVDVAVAGALEPPLSKALLEGLSGSMVFSAGSSVDAYSKSSSGTLPGEGGAFFVLKRRRDALAAHDRIYALVKSVASTAAGGDPQGLVSLFKRAADEAGCDIRSVELAEGHGSGDPSKDSVEFEALSSIWGAYAGGDSPILGLGSVKTNIGHTLRAASAAGIAKTALALRNRVLPPLAEVQDGIDTGEGLASGVYLLREARPWVSGDASGHPRRALVNAFGSGGHAACAILEEEPEVRE